MTKNSKELYLRDDGGIWWYRFTSPVTSKQIRASTKTRNKEEAQKILDLAKATARQKVYKKEQLDIHEIDVSTRYRIEVTIHKIEIVNP